MALEGDGIYRPERRHGRACTECGICSQVCPGVVWDIGATDWKSSFGPDRRANLGSYVSCYCGFAKDERVRQSASSGGMITAILIDLLEKGEIDGAVVVRMNQDRPPLPEMFVARTKEEILGASKSKYGPVHLEKALSDIRQSPGERFALVGLPCHVQGSRKAQLAGVLRPNQIVVTLGLFCGHGASLDLTKFLMKKYGVDGSSVRAIDYRSGGWPDYGYQFEGENTRRFVPFKRSVLGTAWVHNLFTPRRCLVCTDLTAESADISFGDAWLPEFTDRPNGDRTGWSIVVCRNERWREYLEGCETGHKLHLQKISPEMVERSQAGGLFSKKVMASLRAHILYPATKTSLRNGNIPKRLFLRAFNQCLHIRSAQRLYKHGILERIPEVALTSYFQLLSRLHLL